MATIDALPPLAVAPSFLEGLRTIVIRSPYEYSFAGTTFPVAQPHGGATGAMAPGQAIVAALEAHLYGSLYNRPFTGSPLPPVPANFTDITEALSSANPGRERWDHGWQVFDVMASGVVQAHKHGRAQMFYPGQYMLLGASPGMTSGAVQNGAFVSVYLAKEFRNFQPGFYVVAGENVQTYYEQTSLVRIYWNLTPDAAVPLVRDLVSRFNRFQVPFRFKCLAVRELYDRFDAGVLFVGRRRWDIAALLVAELYDRVKQALGPEVPAFVKPLAPGLGLAEDPGTNESFGMSRCRLVAGALWQAASNGQHSEPQRIEAIRSAFAQAGIAPDRPWLSPGSRDQYDVRLG
jgi:hypothetical protein